MGWKVGDPMPPERRAALSAARQGKPAPGVAAAARGQPKSDAHKAAIRAALNRPETRARLRERPRPRTDLPPMSGDQRRLYRKLRRNGTGRAEALAEALRPAGEG